MTIFLCFVNLLQESKVVNIYSITAAEWLKVPTAGIKRYIWTSFQRNMPLCGQMF